MTALKDKSNKNGLFLTYKEAKIWLEWAFFMCKFDIYLFSDRLEYMAHRVQNQTNEHGKNKTKTVKTAPQNI